MEWQGASLLGADELLRGRVKRGRPPRTGERDDLRVFLAEGPRAVADVRAFVKAQDLSESTVKRTKRELAQRSWEHMQNYADAKTVVVREIMARAERG